MPLATTLIQLTPPSLPSGYCPTSYQQLASDIINGTAAQFRSDIGNSFFNFGGFEPSAENRIYPWMDDDGNWWAYQGGYWARKHSVAAGSAERRIFIGSTAELESYDGGSPGTVTQYTGPMWEVDSVFAARFPVGVGTFAESGTVSVGLTSTSTGVAGEDKHALISAENGPHIHDLVLDKVSVADTGGVLRFPNGDSQEQVVPKTFATDSSGEGTPHNNLPPFYGVYFIKRTAREYYTV